ncbi:iron-containing alcohol dehydrogenase [Amycolatopsis magusensis]|uniref:Alcohol dehydrogenase class IV n=1 Tax=Amycolatopsis magusensis TaxID=882444 RepID=A0ABS4Q136_9PSEU|nr:iron-containing alcohol dehydrogenase [Amycolatopsis magusensis]MBP2184865.1 alcohol dehydrogenase class IV [Amycolatopsis magusensis]
MSDFFHLVPQIHYGRGAARLAGAALAGLGVRHVLVVSDPGVVAAGVLEPVLDSLRTAGVAATVFSGVRTNPSEVEVAAAAKAYQDNGCDGFLGAGGGSALDVAKSAAVVVSHGGSIVDFEDGARPVTEPTPPLVQVPTTSGTGSEAVAGAIITDSRRVFKMHVVATGAQVALCDPELTLTLPPGATAAAGIDALAHAIGAYVSAERQPLADAMALYAVSTISRALPEVVADGSDIGARERMMTGSLSAGISMKGGGAVDHAFAHAVNAMFDVHHGVGVALFLADGMEFNLPHLPERFAALAGALGAGDSGEDGIQAVRELVAGLPIPSLAKLGVTESHVPDLVTKMMADEFHLSLNPVPVSKEDAAELFTAAVRRGGA